MRHHAGIDRCLRALALAAAVGSVTAMTTRPSLAPSACGERVNGITLCLASVSATDTLSVEIRNDGSSDVFVDIGIMLANGARQYPNAIVLSLQDSGGIEFDGTSIDPPVVAGRVDPFVIPLPAGAAIRVPLRLSRYLFHAAARPNVVDLAGQHHLIRAKLIGRRPGDSRSGVDVSGRAVASWWTGTAVSNAIAVMIPAASAR